MISVEVTFDIVDASVADTFHEEIIDRFSGMNLLGHKLQYSGDWIRRGDGEVVLSVSFDGVRADADLDYDHGEDSKMLMHYMAAFESDGR